VVKCRRMPMPACSGARAMDVLRVGSEVVCCVVVLRGRCCAAWSGTAVPFRGPFSWAVVRAVELSFGLPGGAGHVGAVAPAAAASARKLRAPEEVGSGSAHKGRRRCRHKMLWLECPPRLPGHKMSENYTRVIPPLSTDSCGFSDEPPTRGTRRPIEWVVRVGLPLAGGQCCGANLR
jgi:hypothetical protein